MSTVKDLRTLAKDLGLRGYSTANKARLIELLGNHEKSSEQSKKSEAPAPSKDAAPEDEAPKNETFEEPAKTEDEPRVEAPKKHNRVRAANPWNTFLAEYRKEHGCSLKDAMKHKDEYTAWKAKKTSA